MNLYNLSRLINIAIQEKAMWDHLGDPADAKRSAVAHYAMITTTNNHFTFTVNLDADNRLFLTLASVTVTKPFIRLADIPAWTDSKFRNTTKETTNMPTYDDTTKDGYPMYNATPEVTSLNRITLTNPGILPTNQKETTVSRIFTFIHNNRIRIMAVIAVLLCVGLLALPKAAGASTIKGNAWTQTHYTGLAVQVTIGKYCPSGDIRFTVKNVGDDKKEFITFNKQNYWVDLLPHSTVVVTVPRSTMRDPWVTIAAPSGQADRTVKSYVPACK